MFLGHQVICPALSVILMSLSHQLCISCVPVRVWFPTKKMPLVHLPQFVSVAVIKTMTQSNARRMGKTGLFHLPAPRPITEGSQGRDHRGAYGGLGLVLFAFLFLPGPRNQRYHCPQWAEPFHISHQEMSHIFSVEIPSQMTSAVSS